jgi:hypothetical protein
MPKIVLRAEARKKGLTRYFTGEPCKRGHLAERMCSTKACVACLKLSQKIYRRTPNGKKYKARAIKRWRKKNPKRVREIARKAQGLPVPTRPEPEHCESCGVSPPEGHVLCLDHDHCSGKFRGWLCKKCNRGIGILGDTLARVEQAAVYLRRATG